jgi:hypothetical protein
VLLPDHQMRGNSTSQSHEVVGAASSALWGGGEPIGGISEGCGSSGKLLHGDAGRTEEGGDGGPDNGLVAPVARSESNSKSVRFLWW